VGDTAGWDPERAYAAILERARDDPSVVGVIVFGSRGAGAFVVDDSDVDAMVIVAGARSEAKRWSTEHGTEVEVWAMTLDEFRVHAMPGTPTAWNRPTFLRVRIDLDRLEGEIARIVERLRRLSPDEAAALADTALDDYINSLYRSLRNLEGGRKLEGRLDGVETIGPLLTSAFALEGRVRPFNKWLPFELAAEPLVQPDLVDLLGLVERILDDPTTDRQRQAFRAVERAARAAGHGAIVDSWEPDVAWLRGDGAG
jgi:predicted nucleotidyltransferase